MKNEFLTTLEKKIDELADRTLERWSRDAQAEEFEKIESAILSFKYDTLKALDKALKKK